jgi:hypothetical protein
MTTATAPATPGPAARPRPVKQYRSYEKIVSSSLVVPSTRIVIVEAWAYGDPVECGVQLHPVLALKSTVVDVYSETDRARLGYSPEHTDLVEWGWEYESREERLRYIINGEFGANEADEELSGQNVSWQAVTCTWTQRSDMKRLADLVEQLKQEALKKETDWKASIARRSNH